MKFTIPKRMLIPTLMSPAVLVLMAAAAAQTMPAPPASSQVMPCPKMQSARPVAGQPMGPRACMGQGMQHRMGPGGAQGPGSKMGRGPMGEASPPSASGSEVIYGSQLMTPGERAAFRAKLHAAKTPEERAKIRAAHHQEMQERAKKLGKTLAPSPQSG